MASYSSILAWEIPRTEEPGGLHAVAKSWTRLSDRAHTPRDLATSPAFGSFLTGAGQFFPTYLSNKKNKNNVSSLSYLSS